MPAKRRKAIGKKDKKITSKKTAKRLEAKRVMLEEKAKKRKGKSQIFLEYGNTFRNRGVFVNIIAFYPLRGQTLNIIK